jgi:hypothetical protein
MDQYSAGSSNEMDYVDSTSIFSGYKRIVQSKNFKGGNITILFGAVELDMSYADVSTAVIDVTQAFGEIKLFVPLGWRIENNVTHFLSVVKDHRIDASQNFQYTKRLVLKGFSTFAAFEILSGDPSA